MPRYEKAVFAFKNINRVVRVRSLKFGKGYSDFINILIVSQSECITIRIHKVVKRIQIYKRYAVCNKNDHSKVKFCNFLLFAVIVPLQFSIVLLAFVCMHHQLNIRD